LENVESYEDIQNKIKNENLKLQKLEESININSTLNTNFSLNNYNINDNIDIEKEKENEDKIKIINPEEIDMKTIIDLSQISTFTKNICLYVKITR
jgi:hypothetical protein